ncbi:cell division protein ZapB [bacterium]|nr:cell division protein ZapB [bacterium]MBU1072301.1 cell division protein ZapB [bacterium]MBU1675143.1 cell division protein ZapB [bacterium]
MHEDSFELLEEKVLSAVRRIQELKTENESLTVQCDELTSQVEALNDRANRAESDLAAARSQVALVDQMEGKRKLIEEKVGGLLDKLDSIA